MNAATQASRRDFLKTGALVGGGLVIGFVDARRQALRDGAAGSRGRRRRVRAQRVPAHRQRRQRHRAARAFRDGPGHLDRAADADRRGARRRLVEDQGRARAGRAGLRPHRLRHADDRRLDHAPGREFDRYRQAGATARAMLVQAAAHALRRAGGRDAAPRTATSSPAASARATASSPTRPRKLPAPTEVADAQGSEGLEDSSASRPGASTRRRRSPAARSSASTCSSTACSPRWSRARRCSAAR